MNQPLGFSAIYSKFTVNKFSKLFTASFLLSPVQCTYVDNVILTSACPSNSDTVLMLTSFSISLVAYV